MNPTREINVTPNTTHVLTLAPIGRYVDGTWVEEVPIGTQVKIVRQGEPEFQPRNIW